MGKRNLCQIISAISQLMLAKTLLGNYKFGFLWGLTLTLYFFASCKKEKIHNPQPVSELILVPDQRMPYIFTKGTGRVMVRSIAGLKIFAHRTNETQNWVHLKGSNFERIIGGIDTLGLDIDEFFDSLNPGSIRRTPISIYSNGTRAIKAEISQKNFPFIFSTNFYLNDNTNTPSSNTKIDRNGTVDRNGKVWTLNIALQDTNKILTLPIYYANSTTPTLQYTRGENIPTSDSILYNIGTISATPPKFIAKDTTLSSEKYLQIKLKASKDNPPNTPIATISVGNEPERIILQIKALK